MSAKIARTLLQYPSIFERTTLPQKKVSTPTHEKVIEPDLHAKIRKATAKASCSPALTSSQTPTVKTVSSSSIADTSTIKIKKTFNKTTNGPSFYDRVFTDENLETGSLVICFALVAGAIGTWASKVGTLAASQIIATNTIAFFKPGITVVGFALKAGMFITVNTVVPVASGLVTILLPVVSTVVVTTISMLIILHFVNKMIQKVEDGVKTGIDTVVGLPGKLLEQIPGYSTISSLFGYGKDSPSEKPTEEPKVASRQNRQRNTSESTRTRDVSKSSATFLDELKTGFRPRPVKRKPTIYTRQNLSRNNTAVGE